MKYAFLFCLLPLLAVAQQDTNSRVGKFSVELDAGIVSSKLKSFGVIFCDRCPRLTYQYINVNLPYYAGTLVYSLGNRHRIGLGGALTEYGFGVIYQKGGNPTIFNKKYYAKFTAIQLQHEYDLLFGKKIKLGVANSFYFEHRRKLGDYYLLKNKQYNKEYTLSHMLRISIGWQLLPKIELMFGPVLRTNLTKQYEYSFRNELHRFGYGALLGLKYWL